MPRVPLLFGVWLVQGRRSGFNRVQAAFIVRLLICAAGSLLARDSQNLEASRESVRQSLSESPFTVELGVSATGFHSAIGPAIGPALGWASRCAPPEPRIATRSRSH